MNYLSICRTSFFFCLFWVLDLFFWSYLVVLFLACGVCVFWTEWMDGRMDLSSLTPSPSLYKSDLNSLNRRGMLFFFFFFFYLLSITLTYKTTIT
ncbi:hypothetical protein CROQUDRAFT_401773 [Cronartium quercuum f. sp. fusiforme G11]|uniref:Uncharacterized protein n=1 Tax=Cronartium quercuum f. sp. fusiforme G11 TaxID=708437 RepID=A0A9P6TGK3_9BASI|nr:hypothetical protein CROQUDRAFT_401773 [Cronartium quercuum f. sp. fusiforme G11]